MNKMRLFATITKVDTVKREVTGIMTEEVTDKAMEKMDYDSSKPYFEKWSGAISKATAGKSLGNVRLMHQPIAVGKITDLMFDDAARRMEITTKCVDDGAWKLIDEGVITGFSIGGNYVGKRWDDPAEKGVKRYTVDPVEVSYVDNPCLASATFTMVKADGVEVQAEFATWNPTNDDVVAKAKELAGDDPDFPGFIEKARAALIEAHAETVLQETPEDVAAFEAAVAEKAADGTETPAEGDTPAEEAAEPAEAAEGEPVVEGEPEVEGEPVTEMQPEAEKAASVPELRQVHMWAAPDGKIFEKKSDAKKHRDALVTLAGGESPLAIAIAKANAAAAGKGAEVEAVVDLAALAVEAGDLSKAMTQLEAIDDVRVEKSMWSVGRFAEVLGSLQSVCVSATYEENNRDGSTVAQQIGEGISTLGAALIDMAREEVAYMISHLNQRGLDIGEIVLVEYVELAAAAEVVKADTALLEKVGARNSKKDAAKIQSTHDHMAELGAKCATGKADEGEVEKRAPEALAEENKVLKAQVSEAVEAVEGFAKMLGDMRTEIDTLRRTPTPMPEIVGKVVTKGQDNTPSTVTEKVTTMADAAETMADIVEKVGIEKVRDLVLSHALSQPIRVR